MSCVVKVEKAENGYEVYLAYGTEWKEYLYNSEAEAVAKIQAELPKLKPVEEKDEFSTAFEIAIGKRKEED